MGLTEFTCVQLKAQELTKKHWKAKDLSKHDQEKDLPVIIKQELGMFF